MFDESISEGIYWRDPVNITKEQWIILLEERDAITEKDIQLLNLIYAIEGCRATAGRLAQLLNMPHHAPLNSQVGRLGRRIVDELNIQAPKQKYGEGFNWWHVLFWGEAAKEGFYWILRPELKDALCELNATEGALSAEELYLNSDENLYEGAKMRIYVNCYERNNIARELCLKYYGSVCYICGFDFEETYGEVGRNVIHVHHLKPLYEIGESYCVDPINDLRPVCPNCHAIIHRKNPPFSIDEVMALIKTTRID